MPQGLQVTSFFKQNIIGGGFEALTPATGDSATFFNVPIGSAAFLGEVWGVDDGGAAELSLTASRFHDQVFGIRVAIPDGSALAPVNRSSNVSPTGLDQPIFPSDVLSVQASGTAADNVNATIVLYYPDIPGIAANLVPYSQVKSSLKNLVGINVPLMSASGDYGTTVALNASDNRLHANTNYAVCGFTTDIPAASVFIQGVDTGNLRVGGPVLAEPEHDAYMFINLDRALNIPGGLIPVINSNNAGSTVLAAAATTGGATNIDVLLAELR
jgi:hypothetical protein